MANSDIPVDMYGDLYSRCLDSLFGADNPGPLLGYDCDSNLQDIEDEMYLMYLEERGTPLRPISLGEPTIPDSAAQPAESIPVDMDSLMAPTQDDSKQDSKSTEPAQQSSTPVTPQDG